MSRVLLLLLLYCLMHATHLRSVRAQTEDCTHTRTILKCVKYLRNYDGDTVTFTIPGVHPLIGEKMPVRVRGIDAPEIKGHLPCEKDAARNARRLVESQLKTAKRIDLVNVSREKYFRILADISVDGKDLGAMLIKNNLAYPYDGGTKQKIDWCGKARMPHSP